MFGTKADPISYNITDYCCTQLAVPGMYKYIWLFVLISSAYVYWPLIQLMS